MYYFPMASVTKYHKIKTAQISYLTILEARILTLISLA